MDEPADAGSLARLRNEANDHAGAERWPALLELEDALRGDGDFWTSIWGPMCAIARWHEGREGARELLEECIGAGFHDLVPFGAMFGESFGTEPDWPALRARIGANGPPPPVELMSWPCARPSWPLGLSRLDPAGEAKLAARLPPPQPGAWATAEGMLAWATNYWPHSGINHVPVPDANLVLERVDHGERFACLEYTIVLTQALNALRIPARRMSLFRPGYHAGMGTAHAVTEAWIDDLGKWVLLDGQNGATWRDSDGVPLGTLELQQRYRDGDQPEFAGAGRNFHAENADTWFEFFHTVSVRDGLAWSAGPYVPLMEGATVIRSERLACSDADAAPDLAAISTGVTDQQGPALVFRADHPYVSGFAVTDPDGAVGFLAPGEALPLARGAGEHRLTVSVKTHYGTLAPQLLHYVAR
jgi:hypothetical protein